MKLLIIGGTGGTGKELKTRCLQTRRRCWKLYYTKTISRADVAHFMLSQLNDVTYSVKQQERHTKYIPTQKIIVVFHFREIVTDSLS